MRSLLRLFLAVVVIGVCLVLLPMPATAQETETWIGSVSFNSDAQPPQNIDLPSFDTMGGTRTLLSVTVELWHRGSAALLADNDDPLKTGSVRGRIVREFSGTGPGVSTGPVTRTVQTAIVALSVDNGDGPLFDPNPPDGTNFGGPVSYPDTLVGLYDLYDPALALYATPGPGTVSFTVTPEFMVNDLRWIVTPDTWQMQAQNADMTITVELNYTFSTPPSVATTDSSSVQPDSVVLRGNIATLGTASSASVSFEYATDEYYLAHGSSYSNETPPQTVNSIGPFTANVINLLNCTGYHFRAKAVGDGVTAYGTDMTFNTGQHDVLTSTGTGTAGMCVSQGVMQNLAAVVEGTLPTEGKPLLYFPHGFWEFRVTNLTPGLGENVTVTIWLPSAAPVGTEYWKYGPTPSNHTPHWYQIAMGDNDGDNVITITLTDGGLGDDDLVPDGIIVDQGGPGGPFPPNPPGGGGGHSAPAFPSIYIGIAAALGAGVAAYAVRRRLAAR